MAGFLDQFRKKVIDSLLKEGSQEPGVEIDDKIALGVLLRVVAEADRKFLPQEAGKIEDILSDYNVVTPDEMPYVMASIKRAADERIDLHRFTRELSGSLEYEMRVKIVRDLFRVACADNELDNDEIETIRKIGKLFNLTHKDFIDAKIEVKKEFGLENDLS